MKTFLWSHMKSQMYECPIETNMALIIKIAIIVSDIQEMPNVVENVSQFLSDEMWKPALQLADIVLSNFFENVRQLNSY